MSNPPIVWALHDGKPGMASQVLGLAEALNIPVTEKRLAVRAPWRRLPPQLWLRPLDAIGPDGDRLEPPWPDLVIGCGRNAAAPARAVKRASGGKTFWVQVQDPHYARDEIDLMVAPAHDGASGANVVSTIGAVHRVTPEKLALDAARFAFLFGDLKRPLVAVLLGGSNRAYRATEKIVADFADRLAALADRGYGIAITPSRRTEPEIVAQLCARLAGYRPYIWDGTGDNPYFGLLGAADAILVTADSVSMVSEAASTGKPVHVVDLDGGSPKFERFHRAMRDSGITRPFTGAIEQWRYDPPDDTARAAAEIKRRLAQRSAA
ncbi:MAG TPA: mitochondrial fission ELM1 family protein [Stellaceae bacterium]|nr:mitochondrial fission ELM1 family protein [Stellaceae bacterium]